MITWKGNQAYLGEKKLGELKERWFAAPRTTKEHFFRVFQGWGVNKELVMDLEGKVPEVRIIVDEGRRVLVAKLETIRVKGADYQADGYEPQYILNEKDFDRVFNSEKRRIE